ncbi:hypothetical protein HAZT_HAZT012233 [Hyalella azteca]|uniref:Uncharacterized protein n=1 Tax=Hyalella azteca TaxID=294128 RepID=A0A6A0H4S0_HYAAZ|nr:hypothetical protein HAZT_HAZT012233 [Hyalella azteca]
MLIKAYFLLIMLIKAYFLLIMLIKAYFLLIMLIKAYFLLIMLIKAYFFYNKIDVTKQLHQLSEIPGSRAKTLCIARQD